MIKAVLIVANNHDSAKVIAGATGYEDAIQTDKDGVFACTLDLAYQCDECGIDNIVEENKDVVYFFMVNTGSVWCEGCRQEFNKLCDRLFYEENEQ